MLALSGLLGLGGLFRYLSYQPDPPPPSRFDLGPPDAYPPGSRTHIPEAVAIVVSTPAGLSAYSLVCPHLGCVVEESFGGFTCPCHGSTFTENGAVIRGPADQNLRQLRVETGPDGQLVLFTD